MHLIEPCCAQRHVKELRSAIRNGGTAEFEGYGDMSLTELLPALLTRYSETELLIAAPSLPDQAAEVIGRWMNRQWSRADGQGRLDVIRRLTLIAGLSAEKSPTASLWLKDNPFGDRLTLVDKEQEDTVILLPDLAITGPVNLRYGHHFTAKAIGRPEDVAAIWEKYLRPEEPEKPEKPEGPDMPEAQDSPEPEKKKGKPSKKEMPGPEAGQENGQGDGGQTIV